MSRTIEESSYLSNVSFISSSNVLKLVAILVMTLLISSLINIQTVNAQIFSFKFGTPGSGDGQFKVPEGVAVVDSTGNIYVADPTNHRIQVFDSSGNFLFKFGTLGTGDGQFNAPIGVAVDSIGTMYVADTNNHRIQVFSASSGTPELGNEGNGGGCSMAGGSVNARQAVANALISLIPVFAIGIRMIRRRGKKRSPLGGS